MIRDHLATEQRGSHVVDVRDLHARGECPEHDDQLAPFQGVMLGATVGVVFVAVLYFGAHIAVALWRAHHS